jgi:hypothetical protein
VSHDRPTQPRSKSSATTIRNCRLAERTPSIERSAATRAAKRPADLASGRSDPHRARLLAHQEEAQCASCHRKIDPIGFGLENWGAAGKWRTTDSYRLRDKKGRGIGKGKTWTIDASGAFHKGPAFSDYHELRDLIADREEDFARGFTEHLIEYALGRPFGFTDEDVASEIVSSAKNKQFAVSEFVQTLVQSKAFRTK